jgi:hypothetical protein
LNRWTIRATIERLDKGGSGVQFGRNNANASAYMAAYLSGSKLTLIDYTGKANYTKVLQEVTVKPEHQKPGTMVMTVEIERDTNTVKCSIGDTEYMNVDVSKHGVRLPMIENYGFFGGSGNTRTVSTAIFRKIETLRSN